MRIGLGIIFALFILCFIAIIIEETFFGGRRRRKAVKLARERAMELSGASTEAPAQQSSDTRHHQQ